MSTYHIGTHDVGNCSHGLPGMKVSKLGPEELRNRTKISPSPM